MTRRFLYTTAIVGALMSSPAFAADIARKAPPPAPLPPPVQDWSGIYSGIEGGYGWGGEGLENNFQSFDLGNQNVFNSLANFPFATVVFPPFAGPGVGPFNNIDSSGWLFGGFIGAQKQWGNWVIGLEADYDWASITGSANSTGTRFELVAVPVNLFPFTPVFVEGADVTRSVRIDTKIDQLATVRGKAGWAFWQNWMIYGTGGFALAHQQVNINATEHVHLIDFSIDEVSDFTRFSNSVGGQTMLGWTIGAGIDYKWQIDPGSAWVFGLEYLHYGFPKNTIGLSDNFGVANNFVSNSQSIDVIKGRISYLFSIH